MQECFVAFFLSFLYFCCYLWSNEHQNSVVMIRHEQHKTMFDQDWLPRCLLVVQSLLPLQGTRKFSANFLQPNFRVIQSSSRFQISKSELLAMLNEIAFGRCGKIWWHNVRNWELRGNLTRFLFLLDGDEDDDDVLSFIIGNSSSRVLYIFNNHQ